MHRLFAVLALLCLALPAWAATRYVAFTGGSDSNSCVQSTNVATPKKTIQSGISCMAAGDTLQIRAGTYAEGLSYNVLCTSGSPCTIMGYPGDARPVLRPPSSIPIGAVIVGNGAAFTTFRDFDVDGIDQPDNRGGFAIYGPDITIQGMNIVNISRSAIGAVGSLFNAAYNPARLIVRNNNILNCGRIQPDDEGDTKGAAVYPEGPNSLIENNIIDGCRSSGVEINYQDNIDTIARNNIIRNLGGASPWGCISSNWEGGTGRQTNPRGITIGGAEGPVRALVYNNLIYNIVGCPVSAGRCLSFWGGVGQNSRFVNNTCYNSGAQYTTISAGSNTHIQNNIFASVGAPQLGGPITGTISNNLSNPTLSSTFVNAAAGDFRLVTGSPAINTGVTQAGFNTDFIGTLRPQGGSWDVGAFEMVSGVAAPNAPTLFEIVRPSN